MTVFELKKFSSLFHRTWREIYMLLFFNAGLIIGNVTFFSKHYLIIELCVFGLLIYKLFNKRSRQIYKLVFNDNELIITYYQFIFLSFTKAISYDELQFKYRYKIYLRGKAPKTIEFKERRDFIAEIKQKYNLGWTSKEVNCIYDTLVKTKQNENNA